MTRNSPAPTGPKYGMINKKAVLRAAVIVQRSKVHLERFCIEGQSVLQRRREHDADHGRRLPRLRGRPHRGRMLRASGAVCRAAAAGLYRKAHPPRHDRSACPRAAVRLPRPRHGPRAARVAQYLYLPRGGQICRSRIRRPRIFQLCGPSAPQHHDARGHLRHDPCARHAPADGKAGGLRPRHLRWQGQHEPQLSALSARAVNEPFPARHRTLDSRYQRRLPAHEAHPHATLHPVVHGRSDVRPCAPARTIRSAGAEPSVRKLQRDRLDSRALPQEQILRRRL